MSLSKVLTRRRLLAVALLVPPAIVLMPETADTRQPCEQAKAWVSEHADRLPSDLPAVAAFPGVYQRAIFHALSPETRAELWRERLDQAPADLTPQQAGLVREARSLVTPELYRGGKVPADFRARVEAAFDTPTINRVFKRLGEPEGSFAGVDATLVQLKVRWSGLAPVAWALPCSCAYDSECYTPDACYWCGTSGGVCTPVVACGYMGTELCAGRCRFKQTC